MKVNNSAVKWLSGVIGKSRIYIFIQLVLQTGLGFTNVIFAVLLRDVVDSAANGSRKDFVWYLLCTVALLLAELLLRAVNRRFTEKAHTVYENRLKERLFRTLLTRDHEKVTEVHSAEWLNRLTSDTVVCANGASDILPGLVGMVIKLVAAVTMLLLIEPWFAAIFIPGGLAMTLVIYGFRRILKRLHKVIQEKDGLLRILLQERLESLPVVKSFAAEEDTMEDARKRMEDHKAARMHRNTFVCLSNLGFGAVMDGMYLLGLAYGGYGILKGTVTYGTLSAILQLVGQIQSPFASITGFLPQFYSMTASAERLMEAESFEEDNAEPLSRGSINELYRDRLVSFGLRGASFSYKSADRNPTVLRDLSVDIKKGQFAAICGHSGCGKSTMLKLFMCLYRLDGGERYMNAGEHIPLTSEYRRLFAYVPQGNHLMSGTIREVVTLPDRDGAKDEERIERALKIACAEEFVGELKNGIDTLLGEKGQGLSEGQMQRLAVARAIYSGAPVLLLDEATSALDELTEKQLLENLRSMTDKTVLIVTHRPRALELCDRVIEMTEDGSCKSKDR